MNNIVFNLKMPLINISFINQLCWGISTPSGVILKPNELYPVLIIFFPLHADIPCHLHEIFLQ